MAKRLCIETSTPRLRELQELTKAQQRDWYTLLFFAAEQDLPGLIDAELMDRSRRTLPRLLGTNWHHFERFLALLVREKLADIEPGGALWLRFFDAQDEDEDMMPRRRGRPGNPESPDAQRARMRRENGGNNGEQIRTNTEQIHENGFVHEEVEALLDPNNSANNSPSSRARRNLTFQKERESNDSTLERSNVGGIGNFVDSQIRDSGLKRGGLRTVEEQWLDQQVSATVAELQDIGSEKSHRLLLKLCLEKGHEELPRLAMQATRDAQAKEQQTGKPIGKPGAYYTKILKGLMAEHQIFVPTKAETDAESPADVRAALQASLRPLPGEGEGAKLSSPPEQIPEQIPVSSRSNGHFAAKNAAKNGAGTNAAANGNRPPPDAETLAAQARLDEKRQSAAASRAGEESETARMGTDRDAGDRDE